MAHPLRRRLGGERQLVAWAHLPRDARAGILEQVVVHPLIAVEIEFARHTLIHAPVAARREEPEPVMLDWPAVCHVVIEYAEDVRHRLETGRRQLRCHVVALQLARRVAEECRAFERVPAVLRDHIDADATCGELGADAARLKAHFLIRQVVVVDGGVAAIAIRGRGAQPVDLQRHVARVRAVHGVVRDLIALGTADVGTRDRDAWRRHRAGLEISGRRQRVLYFPR